MSKNKKKVIIAATLVFIVSVIIMIAFAVAQNPTIISKPAINFLVVVGIIGIALLIVTSKIREDLGKLMLLMVGGACVLAAAITFLGVGLSFLF